MPFLTPLELNNEVHLFTGSPCGPCLASLQLINETQLLTSFVYAAQGYGIINLFLLANLVTTTSTLPVLLGLLEGDVIQRIITPLSVLFGCWFSFASLILWAYFMGPTWDLSFNDVSSCYSHLSWPAQPESTEAWLARLTGCVSLAAGL